MMHELLGIDLYDDKELGVVFLWYYGAVKDE